MNLQAALSEADFFKNLPAASLEQLAQICMTKEVKKRETIFLEGSRGGLFYQLVSGKVQLYRLSEQGREVAIKVVQPGEVFGEVVLFERDRYPVCASALTDCELIAIPSIEFACLLENQEFRNDFISMLMKKQRYLTDRIMYLTSSDAENRFFSFLIEHYGVSEEYEIGMSKRDISTAIGVTPETLSRLLNRLTQAKIIDWSGKRLKVDAAHVSSFEQSGR